MADYLKKPLATSINVAASRRAADAIQLLGKSLPCSVVRVVSSGIVTVAFEVNAAPFTLPQVTVPVQAPEWIRYPIQVGTKGFVQSADVRLGGITGLGAGVPDLTRPANLAALAFSFLGSMEWSDPDDPNALVLYGPNGTVVRTQDHSSSVVVDPQGVKIKGGRLAFFDGALASQQTITGPLSSVSDPAALEVLTSIIAVLVAYNVAVDGTS